MTRHNHHGGDSDSPHAVEHVFRAPPPRRFAHPLRIARLSQPSPFGGSVQRRLPLAFGGKYPPGALSTSHANGISSLGSEAPVPPGVATRRSQGKNIRGLAGQWELAGNLGRETWKGRNFCTTQFYKFLVETLTQ